MSEKVKRKSSLTMADIRITGIEGVEYDEILGFTADIYRATIKYKSGGRERTLTIESEAVKIEFGKNV